MICDQFQENVELYALGALESSEAQALVDHLATGCSTCQDALQRAMEQNLAISSTVPLVEPPRRLRRRVKEAIAPGDQRFRWIPWALAAAAVLLTVAVGFILETRLYRQGSERARLAETLQIVRAPGTKEVSFTDPKLPSVHGSVYIHKQLGLALVIDRLPEAPDGWKYESWVVPRSGAPRPVEPFDPDSNGRAVSVVPGPVEVDEVAALAVSMEPKNSHPVKPTTLVFTAKM